MEFRDVFVLFAEEIFDDCSTAERTNAVTATKMPESIAQRTGSVVRIDIFTLVGDRDDDEKTK